MRRFIIVYHKGFIATPVPVTKNEVIAKTLNGSINILPNPVTGNNFQINLVNITKGNYKAEIFTATMVRFILIKKIEHAGGNNSYKTNLPSGIAAGIYTVSITNSANELIQKISLVVSKN